VSEERSEEGQEVQALSPPGDDGAVGTLSVLPKKEGPVAWMARNAVAANLLMAALIVGGFIFSGQIKQEVFPEFDIDWISVTVPYPGADPEEAEKGIVLALEEAVRGIDGIDELQGSAAEGRGSVYVKLLSSANPNKVLGDIKNAVDRITTLPVDAEEPVVSLMASKREVITLVLHGDVQNAEHVLRNLVESSRDELLGLEEVSQVELAGVRQREIGVEISRNMLRTYGLTLDQVAQTIRRESVDLPAGSVKTRGGEILLRTKERAYTGADFEDIIIRSTKDGAQVRLGDIAKVTDAFVESDEASYFNGEPAAMIRVFRIGDQTPIEVAEAVKKYREELEDRLPPGVEVSIWQDWSEMYRERVDLLLRNAYLGLFLVLLVLGLFLEIRLAFWVTMGIPISFMGSILLMPLFGVSFNMISLFAFIVTLGMVVDDAIVVGENIFEKRQKGLPYLQAAIEGVQEVAVPVTFAILTTVAAFMPMLFVPGISGKLFGVIPSVVISVLLISLVEGLFVLPAHLSHESQKKERGLIYQFSLAFKILFFPLRPLLMLFEWMRKGCSSLLERFVTSLYQPFVRMAVAYRYATIAFCLAMLMMAVGLRVSGTLGWSFLPKIESDRVTARFEFPFGTPVERTEAVQAAIVEAAEEVLVEFGGTDYSRGMYTLLGKRMPSGGPVNLGGGLTGGHRAAVQMRLVPVSDRDFTASEFTKRWREKVGIPTGVEKINFAYEIGMSPGAPVDVKLSHRDIPTLERAAKELGAILAEYPGVKDIDVGFQAGKTQLDFELTEEAANLGMKATDVGRQVRSAFYGAEALRQQRDRDEIRVMVRNPESQRHSEYDVEELVIRTPQGGEAKLRQVARVKRSKSETSIGRSEGKRVVHVTSEIEREETTSEEIVARLKKEVLPELRDRYPGLTTEFAGSQRSQQKSMGSLGLGYLLALLAIFSLLAVPFRSYLQPLVVMSAIPFGLVGAFLGHLIMGFDISMISLMGIIALSGVVVNDSLVLVHTANAFRDEGMSPREAVIRAGMRRFRPILLTSLTTFLGLAPMIWETSVQARFLIPMAISLGFGVLFATFIILVLVPASYLVIEDLKWVCGYGDYGRKKVTEAVEDAPLGSQAV
jgi:multidrug efflux pump subunit AcrB